MLSQNDFYRSGPHDVVESNIGSFQEENPWTVYYRELAIWESNEEIAFLESRVGFENWEGTGIAPPRRPRG